eukprot:g4462.t1
MVHPLPPEAFQASPNNGGLSVSERKDLESRIGKPLVDFLGQSTDIKSLSTILAQNSNSPQFNSDSLRKHIRGLASKRRKVRELRLKMLKDSLIQVKGMVSRIISRRDVFEQYDSRIDKLRAALERRTAALTVRAFAILERQTQMQGELLAWEEKRCDHQTEQVKAAVQLRLFALHLENETSGRVKIKPLEHDSTQFQRCRRAAVDNIKSNFFDGTDMVGLEVFNVFKVENSILLNDFQKKVSNMTDGKVKGLFCSIPSESLDRVLVLGMGKSDDDFKQIFRQTWYGAGAGMEGNSDSLPYARTQVDKSQPMSFPHRFSRYSTLEEDRLKLQSLVSPIGGSKTSKFHGVSYLSLCRVILEKLFVTSREYDGFPTPTKTSAFDSMYSPSQEEYLIMKPENVLPEFIVQFSWKPADNGKSAPWSTLATAGTNRGQIKHIIPSNLSKSTVQDIKQIDISSSARQRKARIARMSPSTAGAIAPVEEPFITPSPLFPTFDNGIVFDQKSYNQAVDNEKKLRAAQHAVAAVARRSNGTNDAAEDTTPITTDRVESVWNQVRMNAESQHEQILQEIEDIFSHFMKQLQTEWRINTEKFGNPKIIESVQAAEKELQEIQSALSQLPRHSRRRHSGGANLRAAAAAARDR